MIREKQIELAPMIIEKVRQIGLMGMIVPKGGSTSIQYVSVIEEIASEF